VKRGAHIVVVGNEKGGSGKSTAAMHLAVGFMAKGLTVTSIDVDPRQGTLSRYLTNRRKFNRAMGRDYPLPQHHTLDAHGPAGPTADEMAADEQRLKLLIEGASLQSDVVLIDTPGSANPLSLMAHSYADTLVTPINDSFVDLDVLAHLDGQQMSILGPSQYSEMVWEAKKRKAERDGAEGGGVDWIVVRNRLTNLDSHNKRDMARTLGELAERIGFRVEGGLGERVIFRELFLVGLTILDLKEEFGKQALTMSHIAARREVHRLVAAVRLPATEESAHTGEPVAEALSN